MKEYQSLSPYYKRREFAVQLRGKLVKIVSKPGVPNANGVSAASMLLAESISIPPYARVLLLGCSHGALGVIVAQYTEQGNISVADKSFLNLLMVEETLAANAITRFDVVTDVNAISAQPEMFDSVVVEPPRSRKLARRWLLDAQIALKEGGRLYLAGANDEGIASIHEDMRTLFGNLVTLGYKKRNRIAYASKSSSSQAHPGWAHEPGITPGTWYEFIATIRDELLHFYSLPGIFSYDRIDEGTALLLQNLEVSPSSRVLDVGCGYGIVGLVASRLGADRVDMVDVDLLAIAAARKNIDANTTPNTRAFPSDALSAVSQESYDLIVTNPPFHTSKAIDYDVAYAFIEQAKYVLNPGGKFMLVANRFIPYDRMMRDVFGSAVRIAETGKYHVLATS